MQPSTPLLSRAPFICAGCVRRLASARGQKTRLRLPYSSRNGFCTAPATRSTPRPSTRAPEALSIALSPLSRYAYSAAAANRPLRIAIIGSGPAGFYTAYRLMNKVQDAVVDMYEQLPVPYGLVRFGVAPDHPEVKNCEDKFEEVAQSPRFNYIGNVKVGCDVGLAEMKPHYDAILFSYGASEDKRLGLPGEDLPGVYSAREFVGWYNGLPQFQDLRPDLISGNQATIIGQGNVALDVARILLTPVDELRHTDITEQALEYLSRSEITSVAVVGRRGPLQASFTVKEIRELMNIPHVEFNSIPDGLYPSDIKKLPRIQRRIGEVILKGTRQNLAANVEKTWGLEFLKSPTSFAPQADGHLGNISFDNQEFAPGEDTLSPFAKVVSTGESSVVRTSLCFRSVGYKAAAIPGLERIGAPFDSKLGIIPNDRFGRVITPAAGPGSLTAGHIPGLYSAGWVKRGPTGVIASTMGDAFASADVIAEDWGSGVPFLNSEKGEHRSTSLGWQGVKEDVLSKGIRPLSWKDWKVIDAAEKAKGMKLNKQREKFTSIEEMLKILDA